MISLAAISTEVDLLDRFRRFLLGKTLPKSMVVNIEFGVVP
jgi:hypothetical protein